MILSIFALQSAGKLLGQTGEPATPAATVTPVAPAMEDAATRRGRAFLERALQERRTSRSIYEDSIILAYDGVHTVLPMGSILHLPMVFRDRIVTEPVGRLVLWPAFLHLHSSWIKLQELPAEVVQGYQPLPAKLEREITFDPKLVIAVYQHNPVTVWEPEKGLSSSRNSSRSHSP